MNEELKNIIIAVPIALIAIIGLNFALIPSEESCLSKPYYYYNSSLEVSTAKMFIPGEFMIIRPICIKYDYEEEAKICTSGN